MTILIYPVQLTVSPDFWIYYKMYSTILKRDNEFSYQYEIVGNLDDM